jgi:tetratricopeptide (TPR) repeat protein
VTRPCRHVAIALVAVALLCRTATAAAPTPEEKAKAREHYQKGLTHYDIKEFSEALTEFKNAYRIVQDPAFLFNIAQCYRKLGQDVEALDYYRNYVRRFPTSPNRAEVDRRIQEIEREQEAKPHPTNPPPNNDQKPDARSGGTITPISPPPPNGNSTGGQTNLAPPPPPPDSSTTLVATAPSPAGESPAIYKRWWFWAGVGVVVAAGAAVGIAVATRGQVGDCRGITPCRTVGE